MPERVRSLIGLLRGYVSDRRHANLLRVALPVSVSLQATRAKVTKAADGAARSAPHIEGVTRDISLSGLALVLPAVRIENRYLTDSEAQLKIVLTLEAGGAVEMRAQTVRYESLGDGESVGQGYLLCVRITEMSDDARSRYAAAIERLKS